MLKPCQKLNVRNTVEFTYLGSCAQEYVPSVLEQCHAEEDEPMMHLNMRTVDHADLVPPKLSLLDLHLLSMPTSQRTFSRRLIRVRSSLLQIERVQT